MIERMTSSIVINANLSQADQAELQQLIASAVGYDNDRGDQIAIQGFDFAQAELIQPLIRKGMNRLRCQRLSQVRHHRRHRVDLVISDF